MLMDYDWPGNIRELENVIERAIILSKGPIINICDFPDFLNAESKKTIAFEGNGNGRLRLKEALKDPEKELILKALDSVNWNRNDASKHLGINRTTLYKNA